MTKIHSTITDSSEIHTPKGFTEAPNDTALIKDENGDLEFRSLSELGATGPQGPAGTTLDNIVVVNINTPSELGSEVGTTQGDIILIHEQVSSGPNPFAIYTWDVSAGDTFYNPPFAIPSTGGTWINTGSGFHQGKLSLEQVSASDFHGSFRHVHREGRGYFLHAGQPHQLLSRVGFNRSDLPGTEVDFFEANDDVYKTKTLGSNTELTFIGYQQNSVRFLEIDSPSSETLTFPSYATLVGAYDTSGVKNYVQMRVIDEGTFATGTITVVSNAFDSGDTITINGASFVFNVEWAAGVSTDESAWNIARSISDSNSSLIKGKVSVSVSGSVITITDRKGGVAGNSTALGVTDGATNNFTLSGATLSGGVDGDILVAIIQEGNVAVDETARISLSTTLLSGCEITINADTTKFDVSAGLGIHVDNTTTPGTPIVTTVVVAEQLAITTTNIGSQTFTSLSVDVSGNIVQRSAIGTPTQRRDTFQLGSVVHQDMATITQTIRAFVPGYDVASQLNDLMDAFGFFLTGGNDITGVSSTLSLQKAAGTGFATGINVDVNTKDPHNTVLPALSPINFFEVKQDGAIIGQDTFIDPTTYDNAGTITTVPNNNNATIQYLYLFGTNQMAILKGQEVYSNFAAAVDASGTETVIVPPDLTTGVLMARIVLTKNSSDITDGSESRIIPSNAIASGGSGGAATTLQQSYDASVAPQTVLESGTGTMQVRDAATPLGSALYQVQNNDGTVDYLSVSVDELKTDTQAYSSMNTLSDAATILTDCADGNVHEVTLTANRTLGAPSNLKDGATYIWILTQDGVGTRTLIYNSVFKFPGGTAPILSTGIGDIDILTGVSDGTNIYCSLGKDFS